MSIDGEVLEKLCESTVTPHGVLAGRPVSVNVTGADPHSVA